MIFLIPENTEFIISKQYDGKSRRLYQKTCPCGKVFYVPANQFDRRTRCSKKCRAFYERDRILVTCDYCGKHFELTPSKMKKSKNKIFFCCREHKDMTQRLTGNPLIHPSHYLGLDDSKDYRIKMFHLHKKQCMCCGYNKDERMLDVHHKDGDRSNNKIENLEIICVWCHGILTRKVLCHKWNGNLAKKEGIS